MVYFLPVSGAVKSSADITVAAEKWRGDTKRKRVCILAMIFRWCAEHIHLVLTIATIITIFIWLLLCRQRLRIKWYTALIVATIHTLFGVLCMHLWALMEGGFDPDTSVGLRLYGGIFVLPIAYLCLAKVAKRPISEILDVGAISTLIGMIYARGTCMVGGCCVGNLIGTLSVRWPIREIELLYYAVFLIYYAAKVHAGKTYGQVYPVYLLSYGTLRFALEWVREEYTGSIGILRLAHLWSIISIIIGAAIYFELHENKQRQTKRRKQK